LRKFSALTFSQHFIYDHRRPNRIGGLGLLRTPLEETVNRVREHRGLGIPVVGFAALHLCSPHALHMRPAEPPAAHSSRTRRPAPPSRYAGSIRQRRPANTHDPPRSYAILLRRSATNLAGLLA